MSKEVPHDCTLLYSLTAYIAAGATVLVMCYALYWLYTRVILNIKPDIDYGHVMVIMVWIGVTLWLMSVALQLSQPAEYTLHNDACFNARSRYADAVKWAKDQVAKESRQALEQKIRDKLKE